MKSDLSLQREALNAVKEIAVLIFTQANKKSKKKAKAKQRLNHMKTVGG